MPLTSLPDLTAAIVKLLWLLGRLCPGSTTGGTGRDLCRDVERGGGGRGTAGGAGIGKRSDRRDRRHPPRPRRSLPEYNPLPLGLRLLPP